MSHQIAKRPTSDQLATKPPYVLHTRIVSGKGGGPEKTILSSAGFLSESGYEMTAAYIYPQDDVGFETIRERAAVLACPLVGISERGAIDPRSLVALWKLCRRHKARVWHAHDYKTNFFGLLLRPLFPSMKLVTTVHGWVVHTQRTPLYYRLDKWCLPRYDRVLCVSDDLYATCASIGVSKDRLELVRNAIDIDFFQRQGTQEDSLLRRERRTPAGRIVIGAMGRLMPEKSFELLVEAVESLTQRGTDVELWIAGEGPMRSQLQQLIADKNLADRVYLLGFVDNTKSFYEALDVFALSSQREGLPNVILEAAAMEVPIVSTRVAGVPNMLDHQVHALLCDIDDQTAITAHLHELAVSYERRRGLARAARQLVETSYSFQQRMARISGIYNDLLSN